MWIRVKLCRCDFHQVLLHPKRTFLTYWLGFWAIYGWWHGRRLVYSSIDFNMVKILRSFTTLSFKLYWLVYLTRNIRLAFDPWHDWIEVLTSQTAFISFLFHLLQHFRIRSELHLTIFIKLLNWHCFYFSWTGSSCKTLSFLKWAVMIRFH